jgi:hypothetical protein
MRRRLHVILLLAALLLGSGCASTPQATRENDAAAKRFEANPAAATLYVYREEQNGGTEDSVLYVDRRLIGATLPASYFRVYVRAGEHQLRGYGYDHGTLEISTRAGEVYFVSLKVVSGYSHFRLEDPVRAKRIITACCGLLENWAPGQRPLLR